VGGNGGSTSTGGFGAIGGAGGSGAEGGAGLAGTGGAAGSAAAGGEPVGGAGGSGEEPCPPGGFGPGDSEGTVEHAGVSFGYRLHVPSGYDGTRRRPLVLNWHGFTSNALQQADLSLMNASADAAGYIVAYPNSSTASWDAGACCYMLGTRDDVGFARALVAEIQSLACVDDRRIYSTGMSNGGFMSHRLACEASDLFAAIAPVAGVNGMAACTPLRPVPVLHFHGTADALVGYEGGGLAGFMAAVGKPVISVPQSFQDWANRNGCTDPAPAETFRNGAAHCDTYRQCTGGTEVTLCTIDNMGHCWPGNMWCPWGVSSTDINANDMMLAFFDRFALP
jgi:polyhydroxybutyrate depolymerase